MQVLYFRLICSQRLKSLILRPKILSAYARLILLYVLRIKFSLFSALVYGFRKKTFSLFGLKLRRRKLYRSISSLCFFCVYIPAYAFRAGWFCANKMRSYTSAILSNWLGSGVLLCVYMLVNVSISGRLVWPFMAPLYNFISAYNLLIFELVRFYNVVAFANIPGSKRGLFFRFPWLRYGFACFRFGRSKTLPPRTL